MKTAKDLAHERECQKLRTRANRAETERFLAEKERDSLKTTVEQQTNIIESQAAIIATLRELLGLSDEEVRLLIKKEKAAEDICKMFSAIQSLTGY